ncbi:MAG: hypothetical protein QE263_08315 [Vampirovibrionales bacterium]|nr:hypothetical protein [Vampirovibrionales bacterium]
MPVDTFILEAKTREEGDRDAIKYAGIRNNFKFIAVIMTPTYCKENSEIIERIKGMFLKHPDKGELKESNGTLCLISKKED